MNELKAYLNAFNKCHLSPQENLQAIALTLEKKGLSLDVLTGPQRLEFNEILLNERRLATQEGVLGALGKTAEAAADIEKLLKHLEEVGRRNEALATIMRRVFSKMDRLPADELKKYVGNMSELVNSLKGVRNIEEVMPFIELSASRKKVLAEFGGPAGVLDYAREFGKLPLGYDAKRLEGVAVKMAKGTVGKTELEDLLNTFRKQGSKNILIYGNDVLNSNLFPGVLKEVPKYRSNKQTKWKVGATKNTKGA